MFLIDGSGSMLLPVDSANSNCTPGCGTSGSNQCPTSCPTRIAELRSALSTWLGSRGDTARFGLTTYPAGTLCEPPTSTAVALPVATTGDQGQSGALLQNANAVVAAVASLAPGGGTPTAASLDFLLTVQGLQQSDSREDVVVLITDGLPNCNVNNANNLCTCGASCSSTQLSACQCTTATCTSTLCSRGCLDSIETIAAVSRLRAANIKTVVIGFGAELSSAVAVSTLDAIARAGGLPKTCPNGTSAECGGMACRSDRTCDQAHFTASNAVALIGVLDTAL